jgi:hypothetical protein
MEEAGDWPKALARVSHYCGNRFDDGVAQSQVTHAV